MTKKTRIIEASSVKHFLDVGDIVEVLEPADEERMIKIETQHGIVGEVSQKNVGEDNKMQ